MTEREKEIVCDCLCKYPNKASERYPNNPDASQKALDRHCEKCPLAARDKGEKPIKEEIPLRMTMPPLPLTRYRCPQCEKVVWDVPGSGYTKPNYCVYCGTKLDWSEYD